MSPKQLVSAWVDAFNQGNADKITEFYASDAINHQVANAKMVCIVENIFEDGDWAILEWKDPIGLRGCGFFKVENSLITFQRGYWDKLSFLKAHNLPIPQ